MAKRASSGPLRGAALAAKQAAKGKPAKVTAPKACGCGCGETTKGGEFAMGHDARHKSNLIKEALTGNNPAAVIELERRGWTKFLDKKREVLANGATRERQRADGIRVYQPTNGPTPEEAARESLARLAEMKMAGEILKVLDRYYMGSPAWLSVGDDTTGIIEGTHEAFSAEESHIAAREGERLRGAQ